MTVVLNGQSTQGRYFVSETLNELILRGGRVGHTEIPAKAYHNLHSPQKVEEYEARLDQIDIRPLHLCQELPGVNGQALDILPLSLGIQRIESQ